MEQSELKKILEAFLFVSPSPVPVSQVKEALGIKEQAFIEAAFGSLKVQYDNEDSGLRLTKIADGYQLSTSPELAPYLKKWLKGQKTRLSKASLETLSIIAYK
ncbi:MAG: SMC-Scp complex subunit ScpB, partial [Candidatus Omnitrophota bacterium]|nr:SMC-Scp complex subunit ScpB [Candidatus Omnitrophota bacterium]